MSDKKVVPIELDHKTTAVWDFIFKQGKAVVIRPYGRTGRGMDMETIPNEMLDFIDVIKFGAKKHGEDSWLDKDNKSMENMNNFSSCARHNALAHTRKEKDKESRLSHHLHAACRHLMKYTRKKRGIDK